jgi:hypothetical protein
MNSSSSSSSSAIKESWVIYFTPNSATKTHSFPTRPWQAQPEFTGELRETSSDKKLGRLQRERDEVES